MIGTVIHGTSRSQDLIPAFLDVLSKLDETGYANECLVTDFPEYPGCDVPNDHPFWDSEAAGWMLEALFDQLSWLGPEGTYFGCHEGDGSDFGFWTIED